MPNKTLVKTHYPDIHCETILTEVFPEKRLKFTGESDAAVASAAVDFAIENGKTYIVSIDREDYEAVAASGEVKTSRGSLSTEAGQMTVKLDAKEAGSHTVRVTTSERNLCKIPEDFLPEHLQFGDKTTTRGGDTLTWDGNSAGLVGSTSRDGITYYKVSDNVFTDAQMKAMTLSVSIGETFVFADEWESAQGVGINATEACTIAFMVASVREDGAVCNGLTFPEKGFYLGSVSGGAYFANKVTSPEPVFVTTTTVVTPLDEKYMPTLTSPGGKKYKLAVTDDGTLTTTAVS